MVIPSGFIHTIDLQLAVLEIEALAIDHCYFSLHLSVLYLYVFIDTFILLSPVPYFHQVVPFLELSFLLFVFISALTAVHTTAVLLQTCKHHTTQILGIFCP